MTLFSSVVEANRDLPGVDQIYEEPARLVEQIQATKVKVKVMPQDNLRELRKKISSGKKVLVAKPSKRFVILVLKVDVKYGRSCQLGFTCSFDAATAETTPHINPSTCVHIY